MPQQGLAARSLVVLATTIPLLAPGSVPVRAQSPEAFVSVTDAMLQDPAPGDWLTWHRSLNSWGYSPLDQIDRDNVDDIQMAWTRALAPGMQQGTPLVYDGVMPMPNPRDVIQALDADTGEIAWKFEQRAGTTSLVATGGGLVFGLIGNGRGCALDHETGEVLREINLGSSVTGFPITYAVDGRQYVVVSTGTSLSSRDNMRLTPELRPSKGNNFFVFALPD